VNESVAELLRRRHVKDPEQVVVNAGLTNVQKTTTAHLVGDMARRLSRADKKDYFPAEGYMAPDAPMPRESSAPAPTSGTLGVASTTSNAPRSRKASKAPPVQAKAGDAGMVDLED